MVAGSFTTGIVPASTALTIEGLYAAADIPLPPTPGRVGLCLSGGGSRALTAGMGQLRALLHLQANGAPLLGQLRAISTVSGGSWVGVPFIYLADAAVADSDYLGPYVADMGQLTLGELEALPKGNAGVPITDDGFNPLMLALEAVALHALVRVPADQLWQTLVGLHILGGHGLWAPDWRLAPTDTFTLDATTLAAEVTNPVGSPPLNPGLAQETIRCVATGPGRVTRPYLICNAAMLLGDSITPALAAVQSGGLFTGILGAPAGTDANGQAAGGGAVTSFAFNSNLSNLRAREGGSASVSQQRQWSLTDAVGTSSAFFAYALQVKFDEWRQDATRFQADLQQNCDGLKAWIRSHLPAEHHLSLIAGLESFVFAELTRFAGLHASLFELQDIVPRYDYWSPAHASPVSVPVPSRFTDGGSLENTGINGMLAYRDIDSLIACVNSMVPLAATDAGVQDGQGGFLPGTNLLVDDCVPPLFGYRPYGDTGQAGYAPYASAGPTAYADYQNNQVFPSADFPTLLRALATAAGEGFTTGSATVAQSLQVLDNPWFGITGGRSVTVVWNYLNYVEAWAAEFAGNPPLLALLENQRGAWQFPNYNTVATQFSPKQVNLLSGLTCWSMVQNAALLTGLFQDGAA